MIKPIEYDPEQFFSQFCLKHPINLGDKKGFEKEKHSEFEEIKFYYTNDFINGFIDWVKEGYPEVDYDDLKPKCFEIQGVGPFLLGQRFKNGDRNMPFVLLILGFDENCLIDHLTAIKTIAQQAYPKIKSKGVTTQLRFSHEVSSNQVIWNQVVYGKYLENTEDEGLKLVRCEEPMNYLKYSQIYHDWSLENPELARFVTKEAEEDLSESAKAGLYFKFYVENEFAGVICGEREDLYGHKAIYIFEELLFKEFRGKGLAKKMQQLFHQKFPEEKYIWGHILAENQPSLKTAMACGRKVLEKEVFFPF